MRWLIRGQSLYEGQFALLVMSNYNRNHSSATLTYTSGLRQLQRSSLTGFPGFVSCSSALELVILPQKSQNSGSSGSGSSTSGSGYTGGVSGSDYGSGASGSGASSSGYYSSASGSDSGYGSGASGSGVSGFGSGYGSGTSGSNAGFTAQDADFARFLAALMSLKLDRSFPQFAWTADQVPRETSEMRSVYPSSHVAQSSSGYQRACDSSSYAKYSQDAFDHVDAKTGSKGQKVY